MTVSQIRTTWTGGPSSPGLTVMNVDGSGTTNWAAAAAAVRTFWSALGGGIPDEYSLQVEALIEEFNEGSGALIGEVSLGVADTPAPLPGTYTGTYAAGVGGRVDWLTSGIRNGRRVRGRTFIVPLASAAFDSAGAVSGANQTAWGTAGQTLIDDLEAAGAPLVVWSKPTLANPVGSMTPVIGVRPASKAAVLRGRRD